MIFQFKSFFRQLKNCVNFFLFKNIFKYIKYNKKYPNIKTKTTKSIQKLKFRKLHYFNIRSRFISMNKK